MCLVINSLQIEDIWARDLAGATWLPLWDGLSSRTGHPDLVCVTYLTALIVFLRVLLERGYDYKVSPNSKDHENQIKQFGFLSRVLRSHWRVLRKRAASWMLLIERPLCRQWGSGKRVWREKEGPIEKDESSVQPVIVPQYQPSDGPYFLLLSRQ